MVTFISFKKIIPVHTSCLSIKEYFSYIFSIFCQRKYKKLELEDIFNKTLTPCKITSTPTGRHALWLFLDSINLCEGDEVLVSAYNFYAFIRILVQKKLVPIFVDIDPQTLCIDPNDLEEKITNKTRLVIVTHMFGNPTDMERIIEICKKDKIKLFEDCAHAIGTKYNKQQVGGFGDGAMLSFGIYKMINAFGGGCLIVPLISNSVFRFPRYLNSFLGSFLDNFLRFIFSILFIPWLHTLFLYPLMKFSKKRIPGLYQIVYPSGNDPSYRFYEENRAPFKDYMKGLIDLQLKQLGTKINRRRRISDKIKKELSSYIKLKFLDEDKFGFSNFSYFGVYVPDPDTLANHLEKCGIIANPREYYDCSSLLQFAEYRKNCKNAKYAEKHLLRIPNYSSLSNKDVNRIIDSIKLFMINN